MHIKFDLARYNRQIPLIGYEGQQRLTASKVLCVGIGGLAAGALPYLVAAGVGTIGLVDEDQVELSNLQRQILFTEEDIGCNKAESAAGHLRKHNSHTKIIPYPEFITSHNAAMLISQYDIIIDCTDNFATRYLINDYCVKLNKPLVTASILQFSGQCMFLIADKRPCYRCLYRQPPRDVANCSQAGVVGIACGLLGLLQATMVFHFIVKTHQLTTNNLITLDLMTLDYHRYTPQRDPQCPCCHYGQSAQSLFATDCYPQNKKLEVTWQQFEQWQQAKYESMYLVDVRDYHEQIVKPGIGGVSIPLADLSSEMTVLPQSSKIIVYCQSGIRSQKAAAILSQAGFQQVYSLQGGLDAIAC